MRIFSLLAAVTIATSPSVASADPGLGELNPLVDFGANPGGLTAMHYRPAPAPPIGAPLVVVLHRCNRPAMEYRAIGLEPMADRYGFHVLYPHKPSETSPAGCFDEVPGPGLDGVSVLEMVDQLIADAGVDAQRIYLIGDGAGGSLTLGLLATMPLRFAGGATRGALPFGCAHDQATRRSCSAGERGLSIEAAAQQVRDAAGDQPLPRLSVWGPRPSDRHATPTTSQVIAQWVAAQAWIGQRTTQALDTYDQHRWANADGHAVVEWNQVNRTRGLAAPDGRTICGGVEAFGLNACAARRSLRFFDAIPDEEAPGLRIVYPNDGADVHGPTEVTVETHDETGVARVEYLIGDQLVATANGPPWSIIWDATDTPIGRIELTARAFDAAGNQTDASVGLDVVGPDGDITPPVIQGFAHPSDGQQVCSEPQVIRVSATDAGGIERVDFYGNDVFIESGAPPSLVATFEPFRYDRGDQIVLRAEVFDLAGNRSVASITVTPVECEEHLPPEAQPPAEDEPPRLRLGTPNADAEVSGPTDIWIGVDSDARVASVTLARIGAGEREIPIASTMDESSLRTVWDATDVAVGEHDFIARATTRRGLRGSLRFQLNVVSTGDDPPTEPPPANAPPPPDDDGSQRPSAPVAALDETPQSSDAGGCSSRPGAPCGWGAALVVLGLGGLRRRLW